jgi:hypothetical protein
MTMFPAGAGPKGSLTLAVSPPYTKEHAKQEKPFLHNILHQHTARNATDDHTKMYYEHPFGHLSYSIFAKFLDFFWNNLKVMTNLITLMRNSCCVSMWGTGDTLCRAGLGPQLNAGAMTNLQLPAKPAMPRRIACWGSRGRCRQKGGGEVNSSGWRVAGWRKRSVEACSRSWPGPVPVP